MKFYLDTCIWRDYFEDRSDGLRPLGMFAFRFLKKCEKKGCRVLYSDLVVQELKSSYSQERIAEVFSSFRHFLVKVPVSNNQVSEARRILLTTKGAHIKDALHAVLARDNEAVMVTRDRHFDALKRLVEIARPEDIYF